MFLCLHILHAILHVYHTRHTLSIVLLQNSQAFFLWEIVYNIQYQPLIDLALFQHRNSLYEQKVTTFTPGWEGRIVVMVSLS